MAISKRTFGYIAAIFLANGGVMITATALALEGSNEPDSVTNERIDAGAVPPVPPRPVGEEAVVEVYTTLLDATITAQGNWPERCRTYREWSQFLLDAAGGVAENAVTLQEMLDAWAVNEFEYGDYRMTAETSARSATSHPAPRLTGPTIVSPAAIVTCGPSSTGPMTRAVGSTVAVGCARSWPDSK